MTREELIAQACRKNTGDCDHCGKPVTGVLVTMHDELYGTCGVECDRAILEAVDGPAPEPRSSRWDSE